MLNNWTVKELWILLVAELQAWIRADTAHAPHYVVQKRAGCFNEGFFSFLSLHSSFVHILFNILHVNHFVKVVQYLIKD